MRSIDFIVQTLLITAALISGLMFWFLSGSIFLFALCQCAVFGWQIASAVVSLITESTSVDLKRKHLLVSILYIISVLTIPALIDHVEFSGFFKTYTVYIIIPAWGLAVFYYYVTWKISLTKRKKGNFLPHLGF
jgi:hypothetical protein